MKIKPKIVLFARNFKTAEKFFSYCEKKFEIETFTVYPFEVLELVIKSTKDFNPDFILFDYCGDDELGIRIFQQIMSWDFIPAFRVAFSQGDILMQHLIGWNVPKDLIFEENFSNQDLMERILKHWDLKFKKAS